MAWVNRWPVVSKTNGQEYTVSISDSGVWACSCPRWKFSKAPKPDCKHILRVKQVNGTPTPTIDQNVPLAAIKVPGETKPKKQINKPAPNEPGMLRVKTGRVIYLDD